MGDKAPEPKRPRWGVLGSGAICNDFAVGLVNGGSTIAAVAARDKSRAEAFAGNVNASRAHDSYEALVNDPEVDIVYVGTIHTQHFPHTKLALEAGKHVLCEKPLAVNAAQAQELVELARKKKLFLMEAVWTRFFPGIRKVRELVESGELGTPRCVQSSFGFVAPNDESHRLWDPAQCGGAMLDIGIYNVQFATCFLGPELPEQIACTGRKSARGVDAEGSVALTWPEKGSASLLHTLSAQPSNETLVICERGTVRIHGPSHCPNKITISKVVSRLETTEETLTFDLPRCPEGLAVNYPNSEGMLYEAQAVEQCLLEGKFECPEMPLDESLTIAKIMDEYRRQLGVVYPCE